MRCEFEFVEMKCKCKICGHVGIYREPDLKKIYRICEEPKQCDFDVQDGIAKCMDCNFEVEVKSDGIALNRDCNYQPPKQKCGNCQNTN